MSVVLSVAAGMEAAQQAPPPAETRTLTITRAAGKIVIDGVIDEEAWQAIEPFDLPFEVLPRQNTPAAVKTEVWLAYDDHNLYAAFRAHDPQPSQIRAHLSDRDRIFSNDFVGLVLDTFNDERRAYELFANPLGIQGDLILNEVAGGTEDSTWDAIWHSAGTITATGYIVEMAIPFSSLRFPSGKREQVWGIDVLRNYPRSERHLFGVTRVDLNRSCRLCQDARLVGLQGITPGRNVQVVPTLTAHRTDSREDFPAGGLSSGDSELDPGITAEWGMTPNLTLSATLNPDFSQVEADAVQLDINTQFTLFFSEKRPFFTEGADYFETPLSVIYTRTVADPDWGAKLTGKEGRSTVGFFTAQDVLTNLIIPGSQGSALTSIDAKNLGTVLRYRYDLGKASTLGVLFTNREGDDYVNRVGGIDAFFRLGKSDTVEAQFLQSQTRYPSSIVAQFGQPSGTFSDPAYHLAYRHSTRTWTWQASYSDIETGFRADAGFMPQVDYHRVTAGIGYSWWGQKGDWYTQIHLESDWERTESQAGQLLEDEREVRGWVQGPLQSFLLVNLGSRERFFNGVTFDETYVGFFGEVRPTGSLYLNMEVFIGDHIDFANTRPAERLFLQPRVTYKLGRHLSAELSHIFDTLEVGGGTLFDANVTQLRTVYQFNPRMFVRAILQHTDISRNVSLYSFPVDAETRRLFPQLLFSYKLNPQTVLFLGYTENRLGDDQVDLTQMDRTFFVKVGYALLF